MEGEQGGRTTRSGNGNVPTSFCFVFSFLPFHLSVLRERERARGGEVQYNCWQRERERERELKRESEQEELHRVKETHAHSQTLYEKEIRRSRKEAFKSSSVVVKLQEDSKAARESFKALQSETSQLRAKVDGRERDAFTARYQLVGAQEELTQLRETLKLLRDERDALKTTLKEEVARVAAQGGIALPLGNPDDEFDSPRKRRVPEPTDPHQMQMVVVDPDKEKLSRITDELRRTLRRMQKAEGQVEHMKMECLFRCCSCRLADSKGETLTYDQAFQGALSRKLGEMEEAIMEIT